MLLIGNGYMITHNPALPFLPDGCVAVDGGLIAEIGDTTSLRAKFPEAEFYDVGGRLIMPGLINAHTHIYSSFARGLNLPQDQPNRNFLDILNNLWWRIDKALNNQDNLYSAYSSGLESIRMGVTTLFDHHASPHHAEGSLFAIAEALSTLGIRASLCYEVSDRDGEAIAEAGIRENMAFINHTAKQTGYMLRSMFGLHASFTLSEATMEKCVSACNGKAGFHIHVAEDKADVEDSFRKYSKRVVQRLHDAGVLGSNTIAVHGVHIGEVEMNILRETNTMAVHNPESNMGNAVGCARALTMLEKGVLLGLGTDAYTQDMFESLKVANIIHKHHLADPAVGFGESLNMLFINNSLIATRSFGLPLGVLIAKAAADIIVVDYTPHTPLNATNIGGHIMFGLSGARVDSTMIAGRFVMKEREILTVDEQAILAKAREQASDLWRRLIGS